MCIASRFSTFLQQPLYGKLVLLSNALTRLKTAIFYRWFFGSMGKRCSLGKPLQLNNPRYMYLGDRVLIRQGARLEAIRLFSHRIPELRIGNDVNIEQNVHIVCQSKVSIGNKVSITGHCAIVDTTHPFVTLGDGQKIGAEILDEESYVIIEDHAFIGFGSVILPNVKIGRYAVIGALSVVDRDVPAFGVVRGNPAKLLSIYRGPASGSNAC
jgi:acetyltransferase-like isoleucine patch superfamily enzyme